MIKSMTGFGQAVCELPKKKIHIEIKSLNSKQLDINARLPVFYREKELEIRNLIGKYLVRGKIDISFFTEVMEEENVPVINQSVVVNYYNQLKQIVNQLKIENNEPLLPIVMRLPDTLSAEKKEVDEKEWAAVSREIIHAAEKVNRFRMQEGESITSHMKQEVDVILELLEEIEKIEKNRIQKIEERIRNNVLTKMSPEEYDQSRFEQELIYYLEKLDFSEEKVRLKNHCTYFTQTLEKEEPVGKKLGFIAQEIGREINTLGSKANDTDIQKLVVQMKDALEKIKEQVLNVL